MKLKALIFLFLQPIIMFCVAQSIFAATATSPTTTPANDLSTQLNALHTMRADFTQTIYDNNGKAIQQSYGRMAIERPGKFRWEITKPIPQLIIANQSRLWIYDADLEQVTIRTLKDATGETPALLLSHVNSALEKNYTVGAAKNSKGLTWFSLTPKTKDNMFATIELGFSNGAVNQMRLRDHLGHSTQIQFKNAQINQPLSPSLFNLKFPPKVDVIDETKSN